MGRRGDRPSLETKTTNKWSDNDASTTAPLTIRVTITADTTATPSSMPSLARRRLIVIAGTFFLFRWAVEVDFLELIEEQVRKARSNLEVDVVVC